MSDIAPFGAVVGQRRVDVSSVPGNGGGKADRIERRLGDAGGIVEGEFEPAHDLVQRRVRADTGAALVQISDAH